MTKASPTWHDSPNEKNEYLIEGIFEEELQFSLHFPKRKTGFYIISLLLIWATKKTMTYIPHEMLIYEGLKIHCNGRKHSQSESPTIKDSIAVEWEKKRDGGQAMTKGFRNL